MITSSLPLQLVLGLCILATTAATSPNEAKPEPITPPTVSLVAAAAFHCPYLCITCDRLLDAVETEEVPYEQCEGDKCGVNEQPCALGGHERCADACDASLADRVDVSAFIEAANEEDVDALKHLLLAHPAKVKIAASRGGIQLTNRCNSSVVAHLPLSSATIAALQAQ